MTHARTMQEQLVDIVELYRATGEEWPTSKRDIARWALRQMPPLFEMQVEDVANVLGNKLAAAMKEETHAAPNGQQMRTYGAYVMSVVEEDGCDKQRHMWTDMRTADPETKHRVFERRLPHGDARKLTVDVVTNNECYLQPGEQPYDLRSRLDFRWIWDEVVEQEEASQLEHVQ